MRLFVGIALPDPVRARLATLQSGVPGARWVDSANLHVTVRFIGEVDGAQADDLDAALAAVRAPALALAISGVGCFERGGEVHTLWADLGRCDALVHLRDKIESAIVRAGFEPERRKFKAHITLARLRDTPIRRLGAYLEAHGAFATEPFAVNSFVLVRSHLNRDGAHYEDIAEYPLAPFSPPSSAGSDSMSSKT